MFPAYSVKARNSSFNTRNRYSIGHNTPRLGAVLPLKITKQRADMKRSTSSLPTAVYQADY